MMGSMMSHGWIVLGVVAIVLVIASSIPLLREPPRRWRITALLARVLAIGLLAVGLSNPHYITEKIPELCVVLVEDRSGSMGSDARTVGRGLLDSLFQVASAEARKQETPGQTGNATADIRGNDGDRLGKQGEHVLPPRVGAVAFAERAATLFAPSTSSEPATADLALGTGGTDIEQGIYRALDLIPRSAKGRILLFSDGHENAGDGLRAARLTRALGVDLTTAAHTSIEGTIGFERPQLDLPRRASMGERFPLRLWVTNSAQLTEEVRVEIVRDGDVQVSSQILEIPGEGAQLIEVPYKIESRGLHCLRARIYRAGGAGELLDQQFGFVNIVGPPRVLLCEPSALLQLIFSADGGFEVVPSQTIPDRVEDLLDYEAVVIRDLPFHSIRGEQVEALISYVSDAGGGLFLAGGRSWIPPKNHPPLALAPLLPVELKGRKIKGQGGIDLVIIMDTSGSMSNRMGGGKTAIDIAFDSVVRVASYLKRQDRLGVLFFASGSAFTWVKKFENVRPDDVTNIRDCQRARCYRSGGGINVDQALAEAYPKIPFAPNRTQHIIVITDSSDSNFVSRSILVTAQQVASNNARGISLSVIGIEYQIVAKDRPNLITLATAGKGEYYGVGMGADIPSLVLEDLKGRERYVQFIDGAVRPRLEIGEDIFGSLRKTRLPALPGYAISSLKPRARALAWVDTRNLTLGGKKVSFKEDDPLLVTWSLGLGRVTAMLASPVSWRRAERLWSQLLRGTARPHGKGEFLMALKKDPGGEYHLTVERTASHQATANLAGRIIGKGGRSEPLLFREEDGGRFTTRFRTEGKRAGLLLEEKGAGGGGFQHIEIHLPDSALSLSGSRERSHGEPNRALLSAMAGEESSGAELDPSHLFRSPEPRKEKAEIRSWCFLGAFALVCIELLVRRLGGDS